MAKIYGERWETVSSLDEGGQAKVFIVNDLHNEVTVPSVLKRIIRWTSRPATSICRSASRTSSR